MARSVNVLYSKARVRKGDLRHPNLEQALRASLNTRIGGVVISTDASLRRSDGAPDYGSLVINHADTMPQGIFIEIVRFAPGSQIPLIRTGAAGREYGLQNAPTPQGTELVRGFMYVMIIGDHFIYVNREIAMHRCEDLLEWILARRTTIATADLSLSFAAELNIETLPSVQRMVLRPREAADARPNEPPPHDGRPVAHRAVAERLTGASVFDILKAAHFTDDRIAALEAQGVDIELKLEVYFKSDGSKHEISRDDLADLIRDVPEKELTLYSKGGREKSGQIKRLAFPAEVETIGELYERPSIQAALWDAHNYFGREGYI